MPGEETPEVVEETVESGPESTTGDTEAVEAEVIELVPELTADELARQEAERALQAERTRREEAEGRLRAVSKAYTDLQAEMEEFKKRMEARSRLQVQSKAAETMRAFFEPIQNLGRAAEAGGDAETLTQGLQMVSKQFHETMTKLGLAEVPGVGAPFNPELHEALALAPVTDAAQDGLILMVHRTGYALGSQVIQPAQVVIGKHEAPTAEA
ncbi:MAG: nucleotide exchange factor GrpE [Proteobacteria bacterium]|nr:nucleotide exchange factor GrpE [Pseudomonadota bacterium]